MLFLKEEKLTSAASLSILFLLLAGSAITGQSRKKL
jgi:hypothetical protein